MKTNENGRSMIEMLGVLAIIGVLSVGGIYGYTMAMRKYKANEIVQTMSMLATMAHAKNAGDGGQVTLEESGLNTTPGGVKFTAMTAGDPDGNEVSEISYTFETNDDDLAKAICAIAPTGASSDQAKRAGYYVSGCAS